MAVKIPLPALTACWLLMIACSGSSRSAGATSQPQGPWISLFNGKDLSGWTPHGSAVWTVQEGILTGQGGRGHIYADPLVRNFEIKGEFRIIDLGKGANSGLYFRAHPPKQDLNGFPQGYEAQICNNQEASTGWLWKPGTPTGAASALLTKDGEWFAMRVQAVGTLIRIWVKDSLVMTHRDGQYRQGMFAIQCHNDGMQAQARNLYYRPLP